MPRTFEAIVFTAPNTVDFGRYELPELGPEDILVKTLYTMVSSGTELRVLSGKGEATDRFPLIPGYCVIGTVAEVGENVRGWRVGDLVSGRDPYRGAEGVKRVYGGQASYNIYSSKSDGRPILLPEGAKPLDYIVTELAAISWRGARLAEARAGETAVVIGQGTIGALSGAWLASLGCRVIVVDVAPVRLERARRWGVAATVNASEGDAFERVSALCPSGPDIVVEASATEPGLRLAFGLVRVERPVAHMKAQWPRLVLQASYTEQITMHPGGFGSGEGALVLKPADRRPEDRAHAVESLRTGTLKASDFLDSVTSFREAPDVYAWLRDRKNEIFSAVFDWSGAE